MLFALGELIGQFPPTFLLRITYEFDDHYFSLKDDFDLFMEYFQPTIPLPEHSGPIHEHSGTTSWNRRFLRSFSGTNVEDRSLVCALDDLWFLEILKRGQRSLAASSTSVWRMDKLCSLSSQFFLHPGVYTAFRSEQPSLNRIKSNVATSTLWVASKLGKGVQTQANSLLQQDKQTQQITMDRVAQCFEFESFGRTLLQQKNVPEYTTSSMSVLDMSFYINAGLWECLLQAFLSKLRKRMMAPLSPRRSSQWKAFISLNALAKSV